MIHQNKESLQKQAYMPNNLQNMLKEVVTVLINYGLYRPFITAVI